MATFTNFFETVKEASMRLSHSVVLYNGAPFYVLCVTDHKQDGVFRIYMDELGNDKGLAHNNYSIPYEWHDEPGKSRGDMMDAWLAENPDKGVIRKMMNSPKFNKFRPFPLGMCNIRGDVCYMERTPMRYTQQGLTNNMVNYNWVTPNGNNAPRPKSALPSLTSYEFFATITDKYPRPDECIKNLHDKDIGNTGIAFNRNFAFIRGPVGLLFLAYKSDIIGYMPNGDLSKVTIAPQAKHTKEVVQELNLFQDIKV